MAKKAKSAKKTSKKDAKSAGDVQGAPETVAAVVEDFTAYKTRTTMHAAADINRLLHLLREHTESYETDKMAGTAYTILGNIYDVIGITIPPAIGAQIKALMVEAMDANLRTHPEQSLAAALVDDDTIAA